MLDNKQKKILMRIGTLTLAVVATILAISLGLFFWPFTLAIFIAVLIEPVLMYLKKKFNVRRGVSSTFLILFIYIAVGSTVYFIASKIINEVVQLVLWIQQNYDVIIDNFKVQYGQLIDLYLRLPEYITSKVYEQSINSVTNIFKSTGDILNKILNFIMFIPNIIVYIIVTFLATLFISKDKSDIQDKLVSQMPSHWLANSGKVIADLISTLGGYLRAQLIMICITFIELVISMYILKVPYAFTIAFAIGLFDALPILGAGGILLPWAIVAATTGNIYLAIGLIITYVIILIVRQLIEPRVVSQNIGVHPIFTLLSMYIGFKFVGLIGLIAGPITMIILKTVFTKVLKKGIVKSIVEGD